MAINHKAAKEFAKKWGGQTWSEEQYGRTFWMDLLDTIYGIKFNDITNLIFEEHTVTNGKIDLWLHNLSTMIEMKSSGVDLDRAEERQGVLKTPFRQVYDYAVSYPKPEQPDYLITCNFDKFRVYSRKEYDDLNLESNALEFTIEDLGNKPEYLGFLLDPKNSHLYRQCEISKKAGELIGKLYNMLWHQYLDPDSEESRHSLNVLCVRLVFCLYCEDAGHFRKPDVFYNFLKDVPAANIRINLQRLFKNLNTKESDRDKYDEAMKDFDYVNGGLFREEVEIPNFTDEIKEFLLEELSRKVDWSQISPTIFGGIFEYTLSPEFRRKGGMHYTSPENIHKVIDPLFLNELNAEFYSIRDNSEYSIIQKNNRYKKLHHKICNLRFLDPAAGSGNFLTETYICLRKLEFAIISELKRGKNYEMFDSAMEGEIKERVSLSQFYGIEINDFAVSVAETAMWISRLKCNAEGIIFYDLDEHDFPLDERANVVCKNALRYDWSELIDPSDISYVMGNPPFKGAHAKPPRTPTQTLELKDAFHGQQGIGEADYVAAWFAKTSDYLSMVNVPFAFVATSSITQGQQPSLIWPYLFAHGWSISYAYKPFLWDNEVTDTAAVAVTIIGATKTTLSQVKFFETDYKSGNVIFCNTVSHLNPYLIEGPDILIPARTEPICSVPHIGIGNKPVDGGFYLFKENEKEAFLSAEPNAEPYFHEWYGSDEFINRKRDMFYGLETYLMKRLTNCLNVEGVLKLFVNTDFQVPVLIQIELLIDLQDFMLKTSRMEHLY